MDDGSIVAWASSGSRHGVWLDPDMYDSTMAVSQPGPWLDPRQDSCWILMRTLAGSWHGIGFDVEYEYISNRTY